MRESEPESAPLELLTVSGRSRGRSQSLYHCIFDVAGGSEDVILSGSCGGLVSTEYFWEQSMRLWELLISTSCVPFPRQNQIVWGSPVSMGVREMRSGDEMGMCVWTGNRAISGCLELSHYYG